MRCALVSAPAHLHAGNYEFTCNESIGRCFGTVGVAVREPRLVVRACRAPRLDVYGRGRWCEELEGYAREYAARLLELVGGDGLSVELVRCYPWGAGLGARANLALTLASAVSSLYETGYTLEELYLAARKPRGSGLGFHAFTRGGLIIEAGFRPGLEPYEVPPLLYHATPRVYVAVVTPLSPLGAVRRLKESVEEKGYPRAPEGLSARLARLLLTGFLGNLAAGDHAAAWRALGEMNRVAGEYWARLGQGSVYCCPETEEAARHLLSHGALAVMQSSWGPSIWGVYLDAGAARRAAARAVEELAQRIGPLLAWATTIDEHGARITTY